MKKGRPSPEAGARWLADRPVIAPLRDDRVLRIAGEEAQRFLEAQLPTAVPPPDSGRALIAACCMPNGRVVATFRLAAAGDGYLVRLPAASADALVSRLARYRLRARVEIEAPGLAAVGLAGPGAERVVAAILGRPAPAAGSSVQRDGLTAVRSAREPARFEILAPRERLDELLGRTPGEAACAGPDTFRLAELRAAIPWLFPETAGSFVPQMLGLVELGAVSFTKGCYPGQEVVARTQHLGKVKRGLVRARVTAGVAPLPGAPIAAGEGDPPREAGTVLYAAPAEQGIELLAVVAHGALAGPPLRLATAPEAPLEIVARVSGADRS